MNIKQIINTCCAFCGITNKELAEKTNQTAQNLNNKLSRNNLKVSELENLIKAMDCRIELKIITTDNKIVYQS